MLSFTPTVHPHRQTPPPHRRRYPRRLQPAPRLLEAKDSKDDLRVEMEKKLALGYPRTNILFQSPTRAILYPY